MIATTTPTIEGKPIIGIALDIEGVGTNTSMLLATVSGTAVVVTRD